MVNLLVEMTFLELDIETVSETKAFTLALPIKGQLYVDLIIFDNQLYFMEEMNQYTPL